MIDLYGERRTIIRSRRGFEKWYAKNYQHLRLRPEECPNTNCFHFPHLSEEGFSQMMDPVSCIHAYHKILEAINKGKHHFAPSSSDYRSKVELFSSCVMGFVKRKNVPEGLRDQTLEWPGNYGFSLSFDSKGIFMSLWEPKEDGTTKDFGIDIGVISKLSDLSTLRLEELVFPGIRRPRKIRSHEISDLMLNIFICFYEMSPEHELELLG